LARTITPTSAVTTVFGRNGSITAQSQVITMLDQITETASRVFQINAKSKTMMLQVHSNSTK
jgi:hypothetical protein